jgi:hypothetical protein
MALNDTILPSASSVKKFYYSQTFVVIWTYHILFPICGRLTKDFCTAGRIGSLPKGEVWGQEDTVALASWTAPWTNKLHMRLPLITTISQL